MTEKTQKKTRTFMNILKVAGIWFLGMGLAGGGIEQGGVGGLLLIMTGLIGALWLSSWVLTNTFEKTKSKLIRTAVLFLFSFTMLGRQPKPVVVDSSSPTASGTTTQQSPTLTTGEIEAQRLAEEQKHKETLLKDQKNNPENYIEVVDYNRGKEGFGTVAEFTLTLKNNSQIDYKDISLKAIYYSNSDTELDSSRTTIYEVLPAGATKTFKKVNFGFVHSQTSKAKVSVTSAELK